MDRLPNVKNVNKGKRHKKKHQFKIGTPVVFKWMGERDYGHISELTFEKGTKNAQYSIKSTGHMGCIYHTMELDDPDDPYCYVSSILTKSIPDTELQKISDHKLGKHLITVVKPSVTKKVVKKKVIKKVAKPKKESVNKSELKKAINKQKDFLNGKVDKNFW
jgi:hypothetical protein